MEVLTIFNSLDANKADRIDNIRPKVCRYCALLLPKPICHLFTISLATSKYTNSVALQLIVLCLFILFGNKSLVSNYRPFLLCIPSKILYAKNHVLATVEPRLSEPPLSEPSVIQTLL